MNSHCLLVSLSGDGCRTTSFSSPKCWAVRLPQGGLRALREASVLPVAVQVASHSTLDTLPGLHGFLPCVSPADSLFFLVSFRLPTSAAGTTIYTCS